MLRSYYVNNKFPDLIRHYFSLKKNQGTYGIFRDVYVY